MTPAAVVALLLLAPAAPAPTGPLVVGVVRGAGATTREAATRIRAELQAAGVMVTVLDLPSVETEAAARGAVGEQRGIGILVLHETSLRRVALWAWEPLGARTVAQEVTLPRPDGHAASRVALHGLEVLRACMVELAVVPLAAEPPARPPPAVSAAASASQPRAPFEGLALTIAAAALHSFEGVGPALSPVGRIGYGRGRVAARVTLMVGGLESRVRAERGQADVRQDLLATELLVALSDGPRWVPFASLGAGAYHVRIRGEAQAPWTSAAPALWTVAALAGGGLAMSLGPRAAILAEGSWLLALRSPIVRIAQDEAGRVGRTSVLLSMGLASRF